MNIRAGKEKYCMRYICVSNVGLHFPGLIDQDYISQGSKVITLKVIHLEGHRFLPLDSHSNVDSESNIFSIKLVEHAGDCFIT